MQSDNLFRAASEKSQRIPMDCAFVPLSRFLPAHWMSWLFSAEFHVFIVITTALVMKQDLRWEIVGVDACELFNAVPWLRCMNSDRRFV